MGMNLLDLKSDKSNSKDEGCLSIAGLGYFINGFCYVAIAGSLSSTPRLLVDYNSDDGHFTIDQVVW